MAANCAICNVSMTTPERTTTYRGTAANLHTDCARLEALQAAFVSESPTARAIIQDQINRLARKKAGLPVQWP